MRNAPALFLALALALAVAAVPLSAAKITEYTLPTATGPYTLTVGPDGNVWVAEWGLNKIARITNAGTITEFPTLETTCNPFGITAGLDGNLWYTCTTTGSIETMDRTGSASRWVVDPAAPTGQIAVGSDGVFWYGAGASGARRMDDSGAILAPSGSGKVSGVAPGPRRSTWFVDWQNGEIWLGNVSGVTADVAVGVTQNSFVVQCRGYGWVTVTGANRIRRMAYSAAAPTLSGQDYVLVGSANAPTGIACGPDGSVWFALSGSNKIARFKNDGLDTYEEFPIPTASSTPWGVAVGSDGSVWFAESAVHKVGRLQLRPVGDVNADGQVSVADVFYLINFLFAGGAAPVAP